MSFKRIPLARFTQGQVGTYVNTMTSDVKGYEQILTHKTGNLLKNISLSIMLLASRSWLAGALASVDYLMVYMMPMLLPMLLAKMLKPVHIASC